MAISAVNVTTSATEVVAAKYNRRLLILQNQSDTDMRIKLDSSATEVTTANGLLLPTGGSPLVMTCNPGEFTNAVRAIHGGSGSKVLHVTEE